MGLSKSRDERVTEAKIRQSRDGTGKKLTPAQIVAQQCKANDAKNKRRGW
jgi:hypothetical protein